MSPYFELNDFQQGYVDVAQYVLKHGDRTAPRGQGTVEVLGAQIRIDAGHLMLPVCTNRNPAQAIAAAEALQLVGGVSYPELMVSIAKKFGEFLDGGTFHGAYGTRTRRQMVDVVDGLRMNTDTRQAVVTIWDPAYDSRGGYRDMPCTISLQFLLRDYELHMLTYMRSNDVWLGLPYDVFQFTQLQCAVAGSLGVQVGTYVHTAGSLHVYDRDASKVEDLRLLGDHRHAEHLMPPSGVWGEQQNWSVVATRARSILKRPSTQPRGLGGVGFWYADVLEPYVSQH